MSGAQALRLPRLLESLRRAPIVDREGYPYFVHPLTDGVPRLAPDLMREVVDALGACLPAEIDLLVTPEAMGIHLTSALSLSTGTPLVVLRKRAYGLPGETRAQQRTGYGASTLHLNDVAPGERVVLVDDVASTGGTILAVAQALEAAGARLLKVLVVINKDLDLPALAERVGAPVEALVRVRVTGQGLEVVA